MENRNKIIIGRNIRRLRDNHGLSTEELAGMLDLSVAFIGLIERGQRGLKLDNLIKLTEIFSIDINDLIQPNYDSGSTVSEGKENLKEKRRKTLNSLVYDLDEKELEFVISCIKSLKKVRSSNLRQNSEKV